MSAKEVQQALQEPETQVSSLGGDTDKAQLALERAQKKLHDFQMAHNAVVNQLARAHAQLQNVYLADKEPDVSFDVRKVGEWLIYLRNTLLTEVYEYVLKKTEELDAEGYGTKVSCYHLSPRRGCFVAGVMVLVADLS